MISVDMINVELANMLWHEAALFAAIPNMFAIGTVPFIITWPVKTNVAGATYRSKSPLPFMRLRLGFAFNANAPDVSRFEFLEPSYSHSVFTGLAFQSVI